MTARAPKPPTPEEIAAWTKRMRVRHFVRQEIYQWLQAKQIRELACPR